MMVDLIVENGRIHTGDPEAAVVDAVAVLNGRIVAAGNDVEGLRGRERVDAHNRVVLPGFNDAHAHSVWFGMTLIETDLSGVRSLDDLYRVVGNRARDGGADGGDVASGFNPVLLHGAVPDPDVLDRVSSSRPVWIKHASGHSCQLNGEGLRRTAALAHLDQEIDGGRIVLRSGPGRPTSILEERAMSFVRDVLLPYPLEVIERALDLATAQYAREGLTSVTNARASPEAGSGTHRASSRPTRTPRSAPSCAPGCRSCRASTHSPASACTPANPHSWAHRRSPHGVG